jgi:glyoxylase-like metal-dependent hydrolase (beta-lactamase superfamily II)
MQGLRIGEFELLWLHGGRFALDGGAIFGVVPKVLWQKRYPADKDNLVPLVACPVLVKTPDSLLIIETGIGNKLTEKQSKIFRVQEEWQVPRDLGNLGLQREDIRHVILTHYDFDHAGGVVMKQEDGGLDLTFPRAAHVIQADEWKDVLAPNRRSVNTYWPVNVETLAQSKNVETVRGEREIVKGVTVIRTGGHTSGHQVVRIESGGQIALHLGDLLPTHAHSNPLWVMAYDNFPLDAVRAKEDLMQKGVAEDAWFTFYHDPFMQACRFDAQGKIEERWPQPDDKRSA